MPFMFWRKPSSRTLYLIRGISGNGKSELAKALTPYNVAADEFPGLYIAGQYQIHHQKASHQWCFSRIEAWMRQGRRKIAVHNTFCEMKHVQEYLVLAQKYRYVVQVIHAEGVILASGEMAQNVHNVPTEIIQQQQETWQSFRIQSDKLFR